MGSFLNNLCSYSIGNSSTLSFVDTFHNLCSQTIIELNYPFNILHYFWLLLIAWTIFQTIQVIIISLIYSLSSIVIWSFIYHPFVVGCWPICLYWSDKRSLILKLDLGCVSNVCVEHIQTGHKDLLPPQVCRRSWWGFWLVVHTC